MSDSLIYEFLASSILVPLVWWLLKNIKQYFDNTNVTFKEGFTSIIESHQDFKKENREIHDVQISKISLAVAQTRLSDVQSIEIIREKMWFYSEKKIEFIRDILKRQDITKNKERIKRDIKVELMEVSAKYIESLNNFISPQGNLGDILSSKFPMDEFLDRVYDIVFKEGNTDAEIIDKIEDIRSTMKHYQNMVIQDIRKQFNTNTYK